MTGDQVEVAMPDITGSMASPAPLAWAPIAALKVVRLRVDGQCFAVTLLLYRCPTRKRYRALGRMTAVSEYGLRAMSEIRTAWLED